MGFNKMKTLLLLSSLSGIFMLLGYLIGSTLGMFIGFVLAMSINFATYWFSDKIVLKMYKAKEVGKHHKLYTIVHDLSKQAKMPMPKVYTIETNTPNAFATGRSPKHSAVAATESLMSMLTEEELKGVMAHELTHIKNRDTLIQTIAVGIAASIAMIAEFFQWMTIFGFGSDEDNAGIGGIIGVMILAILVPIIATIIQLAISRQREYMADAGAVHLIKTPQPLINALRKLEGAIPSQTPVSPSKSPTQSLFIVNPFKGSAMFNLFSTHPSTDKRVEAMKKIKIK